MGSRKHRLIWESFFGSIPKDENGRSYEIHHIDGNHKNNAIENLKLVSIQEHYDIHYNQQDWNACLLISIRMNKSPQELSRLSSEAAKEKIKNGTHHFLKGGPREDLRGENNPMKNPEIARRCGESNKGKIISIETRNKMSSAAKMRPNMICEYCNLLFNRVNYIKWHGENCLENPNNEKKSRATSFTINNPSLKKISCEYCKIECSLPNYKRWHGNNCRRKE